MDVFNYKIKWCHNPGSLTPKIAEDLLPMIEEIRSEIRKNNSYRTEYTCAERFNDNEFVSMYVNGASLGNDKPTDKELITDALFACASSDHYYHYEKDWG